MENKEHIVSVTEEETTQEKKKKKDIPEDTEETKPMAWEYSQHKIYENKHGKGSYVFKRFSQHEK